MRYLWTVCGGIFLFWVGIDYLREFWWPYRPLDQWDYAWYSVNGGLVFFLCNRLVPADHGFWTALKTPAGLLMAVSVFSVGCTILAAAGFYATWAGVHFPNPLTLTTAEYGQNIIKVCYAEVAILLAFSFPWRRIFDAIFRYYKSSDTHPYNALHHYKSVPVPKGQDREVQG